MNAEHAALVQRARQMVARQVIIDEVTAMLVELCNALSGSADWVPEIDTPAIIRQDQNSRKLLPLRKPTPQSAAVKRRKGS